MYDNNRIKVTNTAIIIDNYTLGESDKLENSFTNWDPINHRKELMNIYYDEENKRLYIPGGCDLWFVRNCLNEKYYTRIDPIKYHPINNIQIKFKPRDDVQQEALRFMCGVNEYEDNSYKTQLSLNLFTGKGKTYCSIATIAYYKIKAIIITGSNTLLDQWRSEIIYYTNIKNNEIISINGSEYCNMILNGSSKKANNGKIFLCSHGTLRSFGDRYGWDKVHQLFEYLGIGLKFFDEAHTNMTNMFMIDYFSDVYKTFYVTATPGRSSYREDRIFQISLKNVPYIDLFNEDSDAHTNYIAIKWNSKPTPQVISTCKNMYGLDRNKYMDYITRKKEFYDMLTIIMDMVIKCKGRVLFYIGTNDGILRVYHWMATNYPEFVGDIGIFTSLLPKEQKMNEKKKKLLLSTTKSAGLGEHIEGLKMTIVLAEPFKSEIIARQTLGRTRDDNTIYIELVDLGFIYCRRFYNAKLKVFNKYAKDVSDTTIDNYELQRRSEILREERRDWRTCPIELDDNRFDFSKVLPKIPYVEDTTPKSPVEFYPKEKKKWIN
jgi:superfamily II DNA or RNA helicase